MKTFPKARLLEPLLYALAGLLLLAFSAYESQQHGLRPQVLAALALGYGGLFALLALAAGLAARRGLSLAALAIAQLRGLLALPRALFAWLAERGLARPELAALLLVVLLGIGLRAVFLAQPMRMDEAYTFLYYLNSGRDPFYYAIPNNHVLHSLLAWLSVRLFGIGPAAIRLPAFLAGVLCIPLAFFTGRAFHKNAGLLAALAAAVFPYLVLYSSMARGYSLVVLFSLLLVLLGRYWLERPSGAAVTAIALVSALGMFTMPTMLFTLAGFYVWIGLAVLLLPREGQGLPRRLLAALRGFALPALALTAVLTVLFYTPTVISSNGAQAIFSNRYVDATSWADFSRGLLPHFQQTLADFTRDVPRPLEWAGLLLVLAALFHALRRRDWPAALLLPAIALGGLAVLFAKQAIPFARTWIYLLPFALLFADLGYAFLTGGLRPGLRAALAVVLLLGGLLFAGRLARADAIAAYKDTGAFPEAAVVARYLEPLMNGNEYVVVRDTANYPTFYYLCADGAPKQGRAIDPASARRYFIVQSDRYTLRDLTDEPATPLFSYGDAVIYSSTGGRPPAFPAYTFNCHTP